MPGDTEVAMQVAFCCRDYNYGAVVVYDETTSSSDGQDIVVASLSDTQATPRPCDVDRGAVTCRGTEDKAVVGISFRPI